MEKPPRGYLQDQGFLDASGAPTVDDELLLRIQDSGQLADLVSSYLSRQVMIHTELSLNPNQLDHLFKLVHLVAEEKSKYLFDFVLDYHKKLRDCSGDQAQRNHGPVVWLVTELLKLYTEPVGDVCLLLTVLESVIGIEENVKFVSDCHTVGVVLGSMASRPELREIQLIGARILAVLAKYLPDVRNKAMLREAAVEILVLAINNYKEDIEIVIPSLVSVVGISYTLRFVETDSQRSDDMRSMHREALVFVCFECLGVVLDLQSSYADNETIQTECKRFLDLMEEVEREKTAQKVGEKTAENTDSNATKRLNRDIEESSRGEIDPSNNSDLTISQRDAPSLSKVSNAETENETAIDWSQLEGSGMTLRVTNLSPTAGQSKEELIEEIEAREYSRQNSSEVPSIVVTDESNEKEDSIPEVDTADENRPEEVNDIPNVERENDETLGNETAEHHECNERKLENEALDHAGDVSVDTANRNEVDTVEQGLNLEHNGTEELVDEDVAVGVNERVDSTDVPESRDEIKTNECCENELGDRNDFLESTESSGTLIADGDDFLESTESCVTLVASENEGDVAILTEVSMVTEVSIVTDVSLVTDVPIVTDVDQTKMVVESAEKESKSESSNSSLDLACARLNLRRTTYCVQNPAADSAPHLSPSSESAKTNSAGISSPDCCESRSHELRALSDMEEDSVAKCHYEEDSCADCRSLDEDSYSLSECCSESHDHEYEDFEVGELPVKSRSCPETLDQYYQSFDDEREDLSEDEMEDIVDDDMIDGAQGKKRRGWGSIHPPDVEGLLSNRSPSMIAECIDDAHRVRRLHLPPSHSEPDICSSLERRGWDPMPLNELLYLEEKSLESRSEVSSGTSQCSEADEEGIIDYLLSQPHGYIVQLLVSRTQCLLYVQSYWNRKRYLTVFDILGRPVLRVLEDVRLPAETADFARSRQTETVHSAFISVLGQLTKIDHMTNKMKQKLLVSAEKLLVQPLTPSLTLKVCLCTEEIFRKWKQPDKKSIQSLMATVAKLQKDDDVDDVLQSRLNHLLAIVEQNCEK